MTKFPAPHPLRSAWMSFRYPERRMTTSLPILRWRRDFRMLYQTTLKTGHGEPRRRPFALVQLQRSYGLQPRVARHALPWVQSVPLRTATRFRPASSRASLAATALRLLLRAALSQGRPCGANLGLEARNAFGVKNSALRAAPATMDRPVSNAVWYYPADAGENRQGHGGEKGTGLGAC